MTMPTNRPFFANFFAAFRARTSPTFQAKSTTSSISPTSLVSTAHVSTTAATVTSTNPRTITTKATTSADSTSSNINTNINNNSQQTHTNPLPFSNTTTSHHHRYAAAPLSRSPEPNPSISPGTTTPTGIGGIPRGRQRRGSDSSNSSGGFMDAIGPEKWYIGGRTASGEETFYRLGLVSGGAGKRVRSLDRLSL